MPLVPTTLKSGIESTIKPALEPLIAVHTKKAFFDAMKKFKDVSAAQTGNSGKDVFTDANTQSSQVFSDAMKLLADDIAKTVSAAVSAQVDIYIKSATIIVPPGQLIVGAGGGPAPVSGATSAPSPPALIT